MTPVLSPPVQTYEQAIEYLFGRINYERSQPDSAGEFKLDRMRRLLSLLGDPHLKIPAVHIAGTKGKGSTAAMTAAILTAAGYRTGLYTSPHISRFEERMTVGGQMPTPDELVALVNAIAEPVAQLDGEPGQMSPTYFEIATALAWHYFTMRQVEVVVLEVGLGGRLDATNLCVPDVTVVTTISRDHTALLGHTLEQIAREKAGIIKPGVPVLSAVSDEGAHQVIASISRDNGCPLLRIGHDVRYAWNRAEDAGHHINGPAGVPPATIRVETPWRTWEAVPVPLAGEHQGANAALAVTIADLLDSRGRAVPASAVLGGLPRVHWPVRIERLCEQPTVIVDAAHNWAAVAALVKTLRGMPCSGRRLLVFAGTKDKDVAGLLRQLMPAFDSVILTQYLSNPRAMPLDQLVGATQGMTPLPFHAARDPATAWKLARRLTGPDDLICVAGSFFIAAEMRELVLDEVRRESAIGTAIMPDSSDSNTAAEPETASALTSARTAG